MTFEIRLIVLSLLVSYIFMYLAISSPGDELEHSISMSVPMLLWGFLFFMYWLAMMIIKFKNKQLRNKYIGYILMLPLTWFVAYEFFLQLFYTKLVGMHPVWAEEGRMGGFDSTAALMLGILSVMFLTGYFLYKRKIVNSGQDK